MHAVAFNTKNDHLDAIDKAIKQENIWLQQRLDFAKKFNELYDQKVMLSSDDCLNHLIDYSDHNHLDLVLLAGDIIDYYSPSNYDFLKQSIKSIKSHYLFLCGNHESSSERFYEICKGNFDFNYIDFDELIVVSMDNSQRKIKPNQLKALETLYKHKKPIILVMHIPMMTKHNEITFTKLDDYYSMKDNDCDQITSNFINLASSTDEIKAIFCGHIHGSIVSLVALVV